MVTHATRVMPKDLKVVTGRLVISYRRPHSARLSNMTLEFSDLNVTDVISILEETVPSFLEESYQRKERLTLTTFMPLKDKSSKPTTTTRNSSQSTKK